MSTTRDDILWNRAEAARTAEYEDACDAGYEGTYEQFCEEQKAVSAAKLARAAANPSVEMSDEDINF